MTSPASRLPWRGFSSNHSRQPIRRRPATAQCTTRWQEAFEADAALRVVLGATHEKTLEIVEVANLKRYALAWPK